MILQLLFINFFLFQGLFASELKYSWRDHFYQLIGSQTLEISKKKLSADIKFDKSEDLELVTKVSSKLCLYLMTILRVDHELELIENHRDSAFFVNFLDYYRDQFGKSADLKHVYENDFDEAIAKRRFLEILKSDDLDPDKVIKANKFISSFILSFWYLKINDNSFKNSEGFFNLVKENYQTLIDVIIFLKENNLIFRNKICFDNLYAFGYPLEANWQKELVTSGLRSYILHKFEPIKFFDQALLEKINENFPGFLNIVLKNGSANKIHSILYDTVKKIGYIVKDHYGLFDQLVLRDS